MTEGKKSKVIPANFRAGAAGDGAPASEREMEERREAAEAVARAIAQRAAERPARAVRCVQNYLGHAKDPILRGPFELIEHFHEQVDTAGLINLQGHLLAIMGEELHPLREAADFEGWLGTQNAVLDFLTRPGFIKVGSFIKMLAHALPAYREISRVPTWPKDPKVFVIGPDIQPAKTGALDDLIRNLFRPATPFDAALIKALFAAPAWSQGAGAKPLFLVSASFGDDRGGVGVGKSKLAEMLGYLYLGLNRPGPTTKPDKMREAIAMIPDRRVVLIDNLRARGFQSQDLEELVTASEFQGRALFKGPVVFPNNFTYVVTANEPSVNQDLATRAAVIRLSRPDRSVGDWEGEAKAYIDGNRAAIFADIAYLIESERVVRPAATRFPRFEYDILNKLGDCGDHLQSGQEVIRATDEDLGFEEFFFDQLGRYTDHNWEHAKRLDECAEHDAQILVASSLAQEWYCRYRGVPVRHSPDIARDLSRAVGKFTDELWTVEPGVQLRRGGRRLPRGILLTKKCANIEALKHLYLVEKDSRIQSAAERISITRQGKSE